MQPSAKCTSAVLTWINKRSCGIAAVAIRLEDNGDRSARVREKGRRPIREQSGGAAAAEKLS